MSVVHVTDYDEDGRVETYAITVEEEGVSLLFEEVDG